VKNISVIIFLFFSLLAVACGKHEDAGDANKKKIVTAVKKSVKKKLYYSGVIEPLRIVPIASGFEGRVLKRHFSYGDRISAGQLLFTMKSDKLQEDYRTALSDFLTQKNRYHNSQVSFRGTTVLYKADIVDRQSYVTEKGTVENNRLTYLNARDKLMHVIGKVPGFVDNVEKLSLGNFEQVQKILQKRFDNLKVESNVSGVALLPKKKDKGDSDEAEGKEVYVGSSVKKGDVLVSIGDLSGISVAIEVNEVDVRHIAKNQRVVITSPALLGLVLRGVVSSVGAQAKPS